MNNILELNQEGASTREDAYAKINLALDVTGRLDNGYHLVKMIMETISLKDELTFTCTKEKGIRLSIEVHDKSGVYGEFDESALAVDDDNLIVKAAKALFDAAQIDMDSIGLNIHLIKNIPMAAGMAGGSTDAAAALRAINRLFDLGLSIDELCEIGVKIGADVPYCIRGGSMLAEGIGEKLTVVSSPADAYILLIKPDVNVSTKFVYEHLDNEGTSLHPDVDGMIKTLETKDLQGMCQKLGNVLRDVTVTAHPIILELEEFMKTNGALGALMSGSGPTVFGIYDDYDKCVMAAKLAKEKYPKMYVGYPMEWKAQ